MRKILLCSVAVLTITVSLFTLYRCINRSDTLEMVTKPESANDTAEPAKPTDGEMLKWFGLALLDENGDMLPLDGQQIAVDQRDVYLEENLPTDGFGDDGVARDINWRPRGPQNVGGRTRSLVIDPNHPKIMWAGSATGGIWKTIDGGLHWVAMNSKLGNFDIGSMAIDPDSVSVNGMPTLWAGTGEVHRGDGLWRSTNGGMNWVRMDDTHSKIWVDVFSLSVTHANSHSYMLASVYSPDADETGISASSDGGVNWNNRP